MGMYSDYPGLEFETIIDFCGSGESGKQDGPRSSSKFNNPTAIAFDPQNQTFYVCDEGNNCIRCVSNLGVVGTLHLRWNEQLKNPCGICIDSNDNILYISDTGNHRVISVDRMGHVTVIAANKKKTSSDVLIDIKLRYPLGLGYDPEVHLLYVCDSMNHRVCGLDLRNKTWTRMPLPNEPESETISKPCSIVVKDVYHLALAREYYGDILFLNERWNRSGKFTIEAGTHDLLSNGLDFYRPFGLCYDHKGNLFVSQPLRQCIRYIDTFSTNRVKPSFVILAPRNSKKADKALIFSDALLSPYGIVCDSIGNLIICDKYAHKIKKLVRKGYTEWKVVRLLWIGKKKHQSQECLLSLLPREVIFQVIRFLDKWSIHEYDKPVAKKEKPAYKKKRK